MAAEHEIEQLLRAYEDGSLGATLPLVEGPPLPENASEPMRRIARLAERIVALQLWADMDQPFEVWLAYRFAAKWTGLPEPTAYKAWRRLRKEDWFVVLREEERRPGLPRGTFVLGIAGLGDGAETARAALPAEAGRVEPDDAGRVDQGDEVGERVAVHEAVAGNGREVLERDDAFVAPSGGASGFGGGGHAPNYSTQTGEGVHPSDVLPPLPYEQLHPTVVQQRPRNAILGMDD